MSRCAGALVDGCGVGLASESRVASWDRPRRLPPLRRRCQHRGLGLFLCAGRAHHLHVLARVDEVRGQPICADDFALRTAGKPTCGRLGLRHRAHGLRGFLHWYIAHRHSRSSARLVRLAQSSSPAGGGPLLIFFISSGRWPLLRCGCSSARDAMRPAGGSLFSL